MDLCDLCERPVDTHTRDQTGDTPRNITRDQFQRPRIDRARVCARARFSLASGGVTCFLLRPGSQCIKIPSLIDAEYGPINQDMITPQVSTGHGHPTGQYRT